ncbi:MAG: acetate/propionate family kinase [Chloroflexia bacterium]
MNILVINCGSSTLKFDLLEVGAAGSAGAGRRLAHGVVERIGHEGSVAFRAEGVSVRRVVAVADHREAVAAVFVWLGSLGGDGGKARIGAVGHRVVHGGDRFVTPTLVDDSVLDVLEGLSELAPLHNPAAVKGIRGAREVLGPGVPMVAVFDTAFHSTLPPFAANYALPRELAERHKIRRYGFHGIAHEYMLLRYAELAGVERGEATIITLQLGKGCSAAAIREGRSVDTSMGFTPLEGLVMGTRSGDLDPGVMAYLAREEGVEAGEVEHWLNERSGLLGLSGLSSDMRDLLAAAERDERAGLAVEVFCYRARKYIGAYLAALGGAQAVVFGGGIGEHSPDIRARICGGMEWCGLRLDPSANANATGAEAMISAHDSPVKAYVILVDESALIARYTAEVVSG